MKKLAAVILGLGFALYLSAAVQVTKEYCDRNAERAVTNSLQAVREYVPTVATPIIGNVVTNFLLEEGRVITNVTREVHYIIETNTVHNSWSTNYSTLVVSVQQETNTLFEVGIDGRLRIYKGEELIWEEKE